MLMLFNGDFSNFLIIATSSYKYDVQSCVLSTLCNYKFNFNCNVVVKSLKINKNDQGIKGILIY